MTHALKCSGDSGDVHVTGAGTVTFTTPTGCPLQSLKFDKSAPGFKLKKTGKKGSISYYYKGTPPIPAAGYSFSYKTGPKKAMAGNGTGVIKP